MGGRQRWRGESGQGTVEWVGLVLLVAVLLVGMLAAFGPSIPGGALARAIGARILCAVRLSSACGGEEDPAVERAYGAELAALIHEHAPRVRYERGMEALPVDFRSCRSDACSRGSPTGKVWRSTTGEPVAAFVHVVDCRTIAARSTERSGADCSGDRAGNLYLQYWFYYAGSATAEGEVLDGAIREVSSALGTPSFHRDDWEGK